MAQQRPDSVPSAALLKSYHPSFSDTPVAHRVCVVTGEASAQAMTDVNKNVPKSDRMRML